MLLTKSLTIQGENSEDFYPSHLVFSYPLKAIQSQKSVREVENVFLDFCCVYVHPENPEISSNILK